MKIEASTQPNETHGSGRLTLITIFSTGVFVGAFVMLWLGMLLLGLHWATEPHFAITAS